MQWRDDLPTDWDDAPENPPRVDRMPVKLSRLSDGYVLRPTLTPEEGSESSHSIYSTVIEDVEPAIDPEQ